MKKITLNKRFRSRMAVRMIKREFKRGIAALLSVAMLMTTVDYSMVVNAAEQTKEKEQIMSVIEDTGGGVEVDRVQPEGTILYSGKDIDCDWSIDSDGLLKVKFRKEVGDDECGEFTWLHYRNYVKKAIIEGKCEPYSLCDMFEYCDNLECVDLSKLDTSECISMSFMFCDCDSLKKIDFSGVDTRNVTSMRNMFFSCDQLTDIDVSGFDTSNVESMSGMFDGCTSLKSLDVSRFNTSKVTDMSSMFMDCDSLTNIDVSGFDTSNVENMSGMFRECGLLKSIDVSRFNIAKVTDMSQMFLGSDELNLELDSWNFSSITEHNAKAFSFSGRSIKVPENMPVELEFVSERYIFDKNTNTGYSKVVSYFDENGNVCQYAKKGLPTPMTYTRDDVAMLIPKPGDDGPEYEPISISVEGGEINGVGKAFVRYLLKDTKGKVLKNTKIQYSYDENKTTNQATSDKYGYVQIPTPAYTNTGTKEQTKEVAIEVDGELGQKLGITHIDLKCKVKPLAYSRSMDGTVDGKLGLKKGLGVETKVGPLDATLFAGVTAEKGGANSISAEVTVDKAEDKREMKIYRNVKGSASASAKAKLGSSWGNATSESDDTENQGGFEVTLGSASGSIKGVTSDGIGVVIEDYDKVSASERKKIGKLVLDAIIKEHSGNYLLTQIKRLIKAELVGNYWDEKKHGFALETGTSSSVFEFKINDDNFKVAGVGFRAVDSYEHVAKANEDDYKVGLKAQDSIEFFNVEKSQKFDKFDESKIVLKGYSKGGCNNASVSSSKKKQKEDDKLTLTYATTKDEGYYIKKHSITKYEALSAKGNNISKITNGNVLMDSLYKGKHYFLTKNEVEQVAANFYKSEASISRETSENDVTSIDFPLSLGASLGAGAEIGIEVSGSDAVSYTTGESKCVEVEGEPFISECVVGSIATPQGMVEKESEGLVEEVLLSALRQLTNDKFANVIGKVVDGVKNGAATIRAVKNTAKKRVVSVISILGPSSLLGADGIQEDIVFEGAGARGTIEGKAIALGSPYIVSVTEDEKELAEFKDEPLELEIAYGDMLLEEGLTNEHASAINMYLYDDKTDTYQCLNGKNDVKEQVVVCTITKSGQYMLGIDRMAPIVDGFSVSDQSATPTIQATLNDISGIKSLTMTIDGKVVVNDANRVSYFNQSTLRYQVPSAQKLSSGTHTATITATDTSGNTMKQPASIKFVVAASANAVQAPKKPTIKSIKAKGKALNVNWKKVTGADGYEIQYATKKNSKSKKVKKVAASKKSATISKLKSGKKYYVRMRAYKIINGKKVYSKWSAVKSVKVK